MADVREEQKNRKYREDACTRGTALPPLRPARRREQQPLAEAKVTHWLAKVTHWLAKVAHWLAKVAHGLA